MRAAERRCMGRSQNEKVRRKMRGMCGEVSRRVKCAGQQNTETRD